jgi:hypothetical protein
MDKYIIFKDSDNKYDFQFIKDENYILFNQKRYPIMSENILNSEYKTLTVDTLDSKIMNVKCINNSQLICEREGTVIILNKTQETLVDLQAGITGSSGEHVKLSKNKILKLFNDSAIVIESGTSNVFKYTVNNIQKLGANYTLYTFVDGSTLRINFDNSKPHYFNNIQIEKIE